MSSHAVYNIGLQAFSQLLQPLSASAHICCICVYEVGSHTNVMLATPHFSVLLACYQLVRTLQHYNN